MGSLPSILIILVLCHLSITFALPKPQPSPGIFKSNVTVTKYIGKINGVATKIKFYISNPGINNQNNLDWEMAKTYCVTEGYNFVYLTSHQINTMLTAVIVNNGLSGDTYWTSGIESEYIDDTYHWDHTDGYRQFVYKNWGQNEPRSILGRSCVVMNTLANVPSHGFTWSIEDCLLEKRFICISAS